MNTKIFFALLFLTFSTLSVEAAKKCKCYKKSKLPEKYEKSSTTTTTSPIVDSTSAPSCKTTYINVGTCLEQGQCVQSANGCFKMIMQFDGNLVLYRVSDGFPLWASGTAGTGTERACMQSDGNFVTYLGTSTTFSTATDNHPGAIIALQDDANLVIYESGSTTVLWSSNTVSSCTKEATTCKTTHIDPGTCLEREQCVQSANGCFKLLMQTDGNLVLYRVSDGFPLWASGTAGTLTLRACMQIDGNFVLYSGTDQQPIVSFNSATNNHPGAIIALQDDANLVIYESSTVLWATNVVSKCTKEPPTCKTTHIDPGTCLEREQCVQSANGCFKMLMQTDGNLVIYRNSDGFPLWASGTSGSGTERACMQNDGNFVTYLGTSITHSTSTDNHPGAIIALQDDANLVIYESSTVLWATDVVSQCSHNASISNTSS